MPLYTAAFTPPASPKTVLNRYLIREVLFRLHMATFIHYQPRPAVVLAPRNETRHPPAPHHALSIPHGLPVSHAFPASISSERSCQHARRPALELSDDGVEVVDLTGPDQEDRTHDGRSEADGGSAHNVDALFYSILTGVQENPPLQTPVRALST